MLVYMVNWVDIHFYLLQREIYQILDQNYEK